MKIISLLLIWFITNPSFAVRPKASAQLACGDILAQLDVVDLFQDQAHFRAALTAVLNARLKAKKPIPKLDEHIGTTCESGQCEFKSKWGKIEVVVKLGEGRAVETRDVSPGGKLSEGLGNVLEITTAEGKQYFRPRIGGGEDNENQGNFARKTMAASTLNKELNLNTVPHAKWAKVNGELGALSEEAPGFLMSQTGGRNPKASEYIKALAEADSESLANVTAFEFLVGNRDGVMKNVMLDSKTWEFKVFDHDQGLC